MKALKMIAFIVAVFALALGLGGILTDSPIDTDLSVGATDLAVQVDGVDVTLIFHGVEAQTTAEISGFSRNDLSEAIQCYVPAVSGKGLFTALGRSLHFANVVSRLLAHDKNKYDVITWALYRTINRSLRLPGIVALA